MGMAVTKYTKPEYVGYLCRDAGGRLTVCRQLGTAKKIQTTGIVRINAIDHCTLGLADSKAAVRFSEIDQSYGILAAAMDVVEKDRDGYDIASPGAVVEYDGDF